MQFTESLKQNYEFRRLYRRGKSRTGRCVVAYCLRNGSGKNRLGISVGTKLGCAVVRNRVRRRVRESYRLAESGMKRGYDIVVVGRTRAADADFRQLDTELRELLGELGIYAK